MKWKEKGGNIIEKCELKSEVAVTRYILISLHEKGGRYMGGGAKKCSFKNGRDSPRLNKGGKKLKGFVAFS